MRFHTIRLLVRQAVDNELLVVDDASSDGTQAVLAEMASASVRRYAVPVTRG